MRGRMSMRPLNRDRQRISTVMTALISPPIADTTFAASEALDLRPDQGLACQPEWRSREGWWARQGSNL